MRDPHTFTRERDAYRADRTVERDSGQHQRSARGVDAEHVLRVLLVGADHRDHDLGLVAVAVGERRAQRPVDQAGIQDGGIARAAFSPEERAGNLARGVHSLFDVDREREEVDALTDTFRCVRGREHGGVADGRDHGSLRLRCELAGLEREGLAGASDGTGNGNGLGHGALLSGLLRRGQFPVVCFPGRFPSRRQLAADPPPQQAQVFGLSYVLVWLARVSDAGRVCR